MANIEQQLMEAEAQLKSLEAERDSARRALEQWEEYDSRREDGSGAQDRRHEESGQYRKEQLEEASDAVSAQHRIVNDLKEQLAKA